MLEGRKYARRQQGAWLLTSDLPFSVFSPRLREEKGGI